ncbi:endo-1,4-beta-xylanase 5-like [Andrographis paniculata]|uniref:endo-1,4-beta-xylanase 5-like n=1 Tax=Andrographis paniculata TaxID=175694 RepID=UPI0021E92E23|nr:endo-1,4-beta-xylanase 5-like [Andrographis paniculata]
MKIYSLCFLSIFLGYHHVYAVHYDYSFTQECLDKPQPPLYNGGIIVNSQFNKGLNGWKTYGDAKIERAESEDGNTYIIATARRQPFHSFSQKIYLEKDKLYSFSAWLRISDDGETTTSIGAIVRTRSGSFQHIGWVNARRGCWSMLKGGFLANTSGHAHLYFESNNREVDIWGDNISLQPFTMEEWQSHRQESVEMVRKRKVKFQVRDQNGGVLQNASVSIKVKPRRSNFPFGCAINGNILNNPAYQNWFFSRFKYTVFENELKWYSNENSQGKEEYSKSDALVKLAKSHKVSIRGHNVFWDDPKYQPSWINGLGKEALSSVANKRMKSIISRYRGQLIHWDIVNENLHFDFFESKLGGNAIAAFFQMANKIDGGMIPFLNDYNTIEDNRDSKSSPTKYLDKIKQIRKDGYNGPLAIGVEGHFSMSPNLAYIRSALDQLSSAKLPIWITELDVVSGPNQASWLDAILREVYSHPSVGGIILWSAWSPGGCYRMCLTDNNFKNLPTGDVVDKFKVNFLPTNEIQLTTDFSGYVEASLFHGDYELVATHSTSAHQISTMHKFDVSADVDAAVHLEIKV